MEIAILFVVALVVSGVIFGDRYLRTKRRLQKRNKVVDRTLAANVVAANVVKVDQPVEVSKTVKRKATLPEIIHAAPKNPAPESPAAVPNWMKSLPKAIKRALQEEHRSTALIYALLLDPHNMKVRAQQIAYLKQIENSLISEHIGALFTTIAVRIEDRWRLPIMGQAFMRLHNSPMAAREHLLKCASSTLDAVTASSWQVPLAYLILEHHLKAPLDQATLVDNGSLEDFWSESLIVLGTIARAGHHKPEAIKHAFQAGVLRLPRHGGQDPELPRECDWQVLQECLEQLGQAKLADRKTLVAACAEVVATNKQVSHIEVDLLSTISIVLGCPLPAVLNGTPVKRVSEKTELAIAP
jgi:hypothetical protein